MNNVNISLALLVAASVIIGCQSKTETSEKNIANRDKVFVEQGKEIVFRVEANDENGRNSEGDFVELNDGRILYIYSHFKSDGHDHDPAFLAGRYSSDRGKTWTGKPEVIVPNEGDNNLMSVSLLRLDNGEIALLYLRKNSRTDCIPMMRISNDEAKTWSEPIPVITNKEGYFVLNNDRVIQLENGRLLAPVALFRTPETELTFYGRIWNYYSDDNGRTWQSGEEVPNPDGVMLQEPGVVALKDGRIMMYLRTDRGVQYFSHSEDNGKTWSPVEPGNIPSPRSPATIERIPATGDLLLVWNNKGWPIEAETGRKVLRTPFNSAISKDEGKTWTHIQAIGDDPNVWYNYPAIHFMGNEISLGYNGGYFTEPGKSVIDYTGDEIRDRGRQYYLEIIKLSLDWIYGDNKKIRKSNVQ